MVKKTLVKKNIGEENFGEENFGEQNLGENKFGEFGIYILIALHPWNAEARNTCTKLF